MIDGPDLARYDNSWYSPGRSTLIRSFWFFLGLPISDRPFTLHRH